MGFFPLIAGPPLLRSAPFGWPRTDSGKIDERGMLRDTPGSPPQMYKGDVLVVYNRIDEKVNVL